MANMMACFLGVALTAVATATQMATPELASGEAETGARNPGLGLRAQNVPMWVLRLGYLLVRPGATLGEYHYDCWRLALPGVGQANLSKPPVGYFENHHYHKSTYFRFINECCALAPTYRGCSEWPG